MATATSYHQVGASSSQPQNNNDFETASLLSSSSTAGDFVTLDDIVPHGIASDVPSTPRTPKSVRFELKERNSQFETPGAARQHGDSPDEQDTRWMEEDDYMTHTAVLSGRRDSAVHRAPLLTDTMAPSVAVASADIGFNADDLLENARPKSGMRSAFMNMANSIM